MKTVTIEAGRIEFTDETGSVWSMSPAQAEKHRPMFGADFDKLPKADRDQLAALIAADTVKAVR